MNPEQIARAASALIVLARKDAHALLLARSKFFEVERTEFKRKLKYMEAQRDKWKADATKLRKQVIMSRTKQKETQ